MVKKCIRIFITLIYTSCCVASAGQDCKLNDLLARFNIQYSHSYSGFEKKEVTINDFFVGKFKSNALKDVSMWIFTSKKNKRLGFKIIGYEYATTIDALTKFNEVEVVKQTQDESILGKGWSHVVLQGNYIVLINSNCSYSKDAWIRLKAAFNKVLTNNNCNSKKTIDCECGGHCL